MVLWVLRLHGPKWQEKPYPYPCTTGDTTQ